MLGRLDSAGKFTFAVLLLASLALHLLFAGENISLNGRWIGERGLPAAEPEAGLLRVLDDCAVAVVAAVYSLSGFIHDSSAPEERTYELVLLSRGVAVLFFGFILPFSAYLFGRNPERSFWLAMTLAFLPFSYLPVLRDTGCTPGEAVTAAAAAFFLFSLSGRGEDRKSGIQLAAAAGILAALAPRAGLAAAFGVLLPVFLDRGRRNTGAVPAILFPTLVFVIVSIPLSRLLGESFSLPSVSEFPTALFCLHESLGIPGILLLAGGVAVLARHRDPAWLAPVFVLVAGDGSGRGAVILGVSAAWCSARALGLINRPAVTIKAVLVTSLMAVGLLTRLSPGEPDPMIEALRWMRGIRNCRNIPREASIWIDWTGKFGPDIPTDDFTDVRIGGRPYSEEYLLVQRDAAGDVTAGYRKIKSFGTAGELSLYSAVKELRKMFIDSNGDFTREGGHCFLFEFSGETVHDTEQNPVVSSLKLFEDGEVLGPPHAPHRWIRGKGGGFFSHWGPGKVYFSTSDNTDPNLNGRRYYAVIEEGG